MRTSALLVVDMQNAFCHPGGSLPRLGYGLHDAAGTIAATGRALRAARRTGTPVIYTRVVYRDGHPDLGRNLGAWSVDFAGNDALAAGSWDAEIVAELAPRAGDHVVDKTRFDAFHHTSLEPLLTGLGVDHLWVAGVLTTVCVETTVRAAFVRDIAVSLLADACTDATEHLHRAGVEVMTAWFAVPATVDDLGAGHSDGPREAYGSPPPTA